jgi:hypothetical protein
MGATGGGKAGTDGGGPAGTGIGPTAHQKTDGFNQHGFSGASFASQNCKTVAKNKI